MKSDETIIRKNHMEQLHFITKLLDIKDPNIKIVDVINRNTHKEILFFVNIAVFCICIAIFSFIFLALKLSTALALGAAILSSLFVLKLQRSVIKRKFKKK